MPRPALRLWLESTLLLPLAACGAVAAIAGVPSHEVASVTIVLPGTILVGDTVQARVDLKDAQGRLPQGDLTVTWQSSDPSAVVVDATGRVTGAVVGRSATISARAGKVTGTKLVSVGDDTRLGYALADQPAAAGPYAPDPVTSFNSSGNGATITRASPGVYSVRFMGLGRASGQRDNVQVTGLGGAGGIYCKLAGWQPVGADMTVDVHCFTAAGAAADSRFTVLLSGARVYIPTSRFGFVLVPDFTGAVNLVDTSGTTRNNSSTSLIQLGHVGLGNYSLIFPGLERVPGPQQGPETFQVTAVGAGPERCFIAAVDPLHAGLNVKCTDAAGNPADSRFSVMLFQRGRPGVDGYRFGYALADKPGSTVDYITSATFSRNNSGGNILARKLATGQYRVLFEGQAKAPGATETLLLTPINVAGICTLTSWGNSGATDLAVTLACFDNSGAPADAQFNILLVQ